MLTLRRGAHLTSMSQCTSGRWSRNTALSNSGNKGVLNIKVRTAHKRYLDVKHMKQVQYELLILLIFVLWKKNMYMDGGSEAKFFPSALGGDCTKGSD